MVVSLDKTFNEKIFTNTLHKWNLLLSVKYINMSLGLSITNNTSGSMTINIIMSQYGALFQIFMYMKEY
jgi:hypothetical protein